MVAAFLLRDRAWAFLALSVAFTAVSIQLANQPNLLDVEQGFFGVLKMNRVDVPSLGMVRELSHGTTLHGAQADDPAMRCKPLFTTPKIRRLDKYSRRFRRASRQLLSALLGWEPAPWRLTPEQAIVCAFSKLTLWS